MLRRTLILLPAFAFTADAQVPGLPPELQSVIEESSATPPPSAPSTDDPLLLAVRLCDAITGDDDKKCAMQLRVASALISAGRHDEAAALAGRISDYRAVQALIHLMENTRKEQPHLAEVEKRLPACKPWQQELLRTALHHAGLRLGWKEPRLVEIMADVRDEELRTSAVIQRLAHAACHADQLDREAAEKELSKIKGPAPGVLVSAMDLLAAALEARLKKTGAETARAGQLTQDALFLMRRSHVSFVSEALTAATDLMRAGFEAEAKEIFLTTEGRLGGETEQAAWIQYQTACLWKLRGRQIAALALLTQAEKQAHALRHMDRAFGLAWVSAAWRELGDTVRADACMTEAAKQASTNVNPRMRHVGAIEICLTHAHERRTLPAALQTALHDILLGKSGDDSATPAP